MHNQVTIRIRVRMEPDLEEIAGHMRPHQRRQLARKFFRYAKQLYVSADIIERDQQPKPPPVRVPFCPENKLKGN